VVVQAYGQKMRCGWRKLRMNRSEKLMQRPDYVESLGCVGSRIDWADLIILGPERMILALAV
jgi:hypothetical protein